MSDNILEINYLYHKYAIDWAVKNVSFNIKKNGIFGLLGANGAGKSTIMNIMCGALKQTEGEVFINGIDLKEQPVEAKRQIGFLPQKAPLYLDNTIDEYLRHCARLRLIPEREIQNAVEDAKAACELAHFSKRLIKNLSGGYRQRVAIAGSIIHKPSLVVLDEPTVGLDPVQIVAVRKIIEEIGKDRAVIFSTHIMSEVQMVCDEIKMIDGGKLVFSGTVEEFNDYIKPDSLVLRHANAPSLEDIEKIHGVLLVEEISDDKIRVKYDSGINVSEELIKAGVQHNWRLQEVIIERSSLDDVFAKITKDLKENKYKA